MATNHQIRYQATQKGISQSGDYRMKCSQYTVATSAILCIWCVTWSIKPQQCPFQLMQFLCQGTWELHEAKA